VIVFCIINAVNARCHSSIIVPHNACFIGITLSIEHALGHGDFYTLTDIGLIFWITCIMVCAIDTTLIHITPGLSLEELESSSGS